MVYTNVLAYFFKNREYNEAIAQRVISSCNTIFLLFNIIIINQSYGMYEI